MQVKLFEVRDRATAIPCFAFRVNPTVYDRPTPSEVEQHNTEGWLLGRAGFDPAGEHVIFGSLENPTRCQYDPYAWPVNPRTLRQAHIYVTDNWEFLQSGAVIDVEYILAESSNAKRSERVS